MRVITGVRASSRLGVGAGVAAAAAVAAALLSGCGVVSFGGARATATPVPAASDSPGGGSAAASPGVAVSGGAVTGDQARILAALPKRPATALPWDKAQNPSAIGVITAEQFIEADYKQASWADERGIQKGRGLQYAVRQNWYDPAAGVYVDSFIIHYASASGAQSDYLSQVRADAKDWDATGGYAVPGIGQSKVFVAAKLDSFGNSTSMGLALAGDNVLRIVQINPAAPDHTTMTGLLTGEYQALTRS
ncbi:hypothetical protein [Streptacidiphilus anmyonensis]|uniref:hypothetical protein n=1 Tax=Streptacidiphilus anmyonensis TaxID=405782 RepID=UPI0005A6E691|nr:hypothetical protein [Streptacidiphilus anmyonensis]